MKNVMRYPLLLALVFGLVFTSCVSNKKFAASETRGDNLQIENAKIISQLNDCNAEVKSLKSDKAILQDEIASVEDDLKALSASSNMTIADQAKRLKNLQDNLQAQRDVMTNLQNSIAAALMHYKADELSVYIKDGSVYVSLAEKLLFKSGSDMVNAKGKEALKSLADVINNTKDINVMIEGHTDNVPIKTSHYKDNWDLSAARATSIVRILTKDYGFDPNRITASGKGEFHPVTTNETPEGRAGNRRTEIIISPDLSELYKILYQ